MPRPPIYRKDPLYWEPFWPNFVAALKPRLIGFKVRSEMALGTVILVGIETYLFKIGAPKVWTEHWALVLFLVLFAALTNYFVVALICRVTSALWQVCRKPRFREQSAVIAGTVLVAILWSGFMWYNFYISTSHFTLEIQNWWAIFNDYDYPGASKSFPVSSVFFLSTKAN